MFQLFRRSLSCISVPPTKSFVEEKKRKNKTSEFVINRHSIKQMANIRSKL